MSRAATGAVTPKSANPLLRAPLRAWRRLTSMRTALVLLFLLAVAAVPGSVLPQRPINPVKTDDYIASHGAWGRFLDAIGMFDVFGAPWFAAIYLLLFVSLVGCLVPRIRVHARAVARAPLPAPRHLDRLPESARFGVAGDSSTYATAARQALGRRWRVVRREEPGGAVTLSAEKGYSRETGNLLFHVALLCALVLVGVGRLYTYQGSVVVTQGDGFCNTVSQYDSWRPGRLAAEGRVGPAPFCIDRVRKFTATYTAEGEPTAFAADVTYHEVGTGDRADGPEQHATLRVNHPLRLMGDRVYLIGHGFSPVITVTEPNGRVVRDVKPFAPEDPSTLQSTGAFKFQLPGDAQGHFTHDIGLLGSFSPDPVKQSAVTYASRSPIVRNPVLGLAMYVGDLGNRGIPQSIYSLDTTHMKLKGAANLRIGQSHTFPNGATVRFDGWKPWVSIQVSHDPAQGWLLWAALAMVAGLVLSLGVRRRRVWLRITPAGGADETLPTVVSVGGLARSDSGNFTTEFDELVRRLEDAAPSPQAPRDEGGAPPDIEGVEGVENPDIVAAGRD